MNTAAGCGVNAASGIGAKNTSSTKQHRDFAESIMKWHTEFGHLNRGDMLTSEQHRCSNEKKKF
ncbi:hypothetical protein CBL22_20000 [Shigella flexneri]|nr:hypothetical protein CBW45_20450 [Shigella flexneri]OUZ83657.1 hypothetical protein CBL22_20000 [Shigella flexneri]